jgi:hypothetical protein
MRFGCDHLLPNFEIDCATRIMCCFFSIMAGMGVGLEFFFKTTPWAFELRKEREKK